MEAAELILGVKPNNEKMPSLTRLYILVEVKHLGEVFFFFC